LSLYAPGHDAAADPLALHRCFQRHGISRLPDMEGDKPAKKKFRQYPIGYFHIDIAEVRTEQGKLYLFVAIDRTSKFAFAELHERATRRISANFLRALITAVPTRFTPCSAITARTLWTTRQTQPGLSKSPKQSSLFSSELMPLPMPCEQHAIEYRRTRPKHPWNNGQVERMNRTLKEATVKRYYYQTHQQLKEHLQTFLMAYNFARKLKPLRGLTPSVPLPIPAEIPSSVYHQPLPSHRGTKQLDRPKPPLARCKRRRIDQIWA
jgi:hypothetical protein